MQQQHSAALSYVRMKGRQKIVQQKRDIFATPVISGM